ncbi:MAG: bifunctional ornithine acetyltransferase/N-acetylglutamate synthase [Thermoguttaceae bacterium]|nr:bifunctional ornithine acetyltransferase/N-acetylglutamate synthase [Thermoguttaceae bacterium]MDW8038313.1 bifunctional ornithine acetyltransferase/N-acetylglutamate synthase [Thermoguttaceae bacterium]
MPEPLTMELRLPEGFRCAGVCSGIKLQAGALDLTLVVSDRPAVGVGVYTTNLVQAAPVLWDRQHTPSSRVRAIVANSGNANACTGQRGMEDCRRMAELVAQAIGAQPDQVLVLSTGIIGHYLPMDRIAAGIQQAAQQLGQEESHLLAAARGIMTTDTRPKLACRTLLLDSRPQIASTLQEADFGQKAAQKHPLPLGPGFHASDQGKADPSDGQTLAPGEAASRPPKQQARQIVITGMAKGAGMIAPRLATMLAIILTDAPLDPAAAQDLLAETTEETFNCVSIDGHTSTNDTVLVLANGAAGGEPLSEAPWQAFREAFREVCQELAKAIAADGEGATHLITIHVRGCTSRQDARQIARSVAESLLVKTAIAGADPNWGRIVSAAGYAGVKFNPNRLTLRLNGFLLFADGQPAHFNPQEVSNSLQANRHTLIELNLAEGQAEATLWTTDLTTEYVRINAEYHT